MAEFILEARGVTKVFPGVCALNNVDLRVKQGEVHAVVGENGAGKSTLMLVLGGIYRPDGGEIFVDGQKVQFDSAHDANKKGIGVVYQELSLAQNLSVAENIFANRQPVRFFNLIDQKLLNKQAEEMLALAFASSGGAASAISPDTLVKNLSVANQQVVEILKAMSFNPKVLILDEPTSSLTSTEVKQLFKNIKRLKEQGVAIIYISHHLQELFEIADTVTILRDGSQVFTGPLSGLDEDFLITKMVGRKIENIYGQRDNQDKIGANLFEAKNLCRKGAFKNISFTIKSGEIVGFAGLVGAGRTEVGRAIFGVEPLDSGSIFMDGKELQIRNPNQAIAHHIGYMTEDRKAQGLYLNFTLTVNLIANRLRDFSPLGFMKRKLLEENANNAVKDFRIVTPSINQIVNNLSGGNQQKVLLGAWFGIKPRLLIVDEPTRGVDVGARSEIYELLRKLAKTGIAVMVISSDLPEILGLSDRIYVMKDGGISGEISREEATEDKVLTLALGG
jgi:ABC-type sugar transport system ATPase subunit